MKKIFLLSALAASICIGNAVFALSDWDAWQSNTDWQGLSGGDEQRTRQYNTNRENEDDICKGREGETIYTKDVWIYCPPPERDLGRWGGTLYN